MWSFLNWSVADIFFWFWYEFLLAGLATQALLLVWSILSIKPRHNQGTSPLLFLFSFSLVLFYASLFSAVAYKGEWKTWDHFPEFIATKQIELSATFISFAVFLGATLLKREYGVDDWERIELQYGRRSVAILGLYMVLIFQYHWTGAHNMPMTVPFLKEMGGILLGFKALAEAGLFDRFFGQRHKMNLHL